MDLTFAVGVCAAILTTSSFIPQVFKSIHTRSTHDLSMRMLIILTFGILLWLLYGILRLDPIITAANAIGLGLMLTLCVLKLKYG